MSAASAAAMSLRFSAKMASSLASRASAMEYSSAARSSLLRFWSWRLALRAATAWSRVDMPDMSKSRALIWDDP